ncbi:MAG: CBS domain-containing protein, partial [Methanobacteriaceae archaeon]|nr:CBS domain-containing protein [Methanobacteriaceae archaeon]
MKSEISTNQIENLITSKVPTCLLNQTIGELEEYLEINSIEFDNIDYIYVLDDSNSLQGVISIKKLLSSDHPLKASAVMHPDPISITKNTEPEEVVYLALSHGLKSIPVIENGNDFLGIITHYDILRIFNKEVQEDIF